MRYKQLGKTGLVVSEVCFGTMTFGGDGFWKVIGTQDQKDADQLVQTAIDGGVNFFDTADIYSNGQSEKILGAALKNLSIARDEVVIATKAHGRVVEGLQTNPNELKTRVGKRESLPNLSGQSRKYLLHAVDRSLDRLNTDYIDLYQVHGFDPVTPLEETLETLDAIVKSGKVRYIGLCNHAAWQIMKGLSISDKNGLSRWSSLQMYYSMAGRDIEREVVPLAQDQNLAILPWSPLAGGLLSGKFSRSNTNPENARRANFDFPPVNRERAYDCIDVLENMAKERNCSVARVALAWVMQKPFITSTIIGAKRIEQLNDNLAATELKLTQEEIQKLDEVSALPREYPGWMLQRMGADRLQQIS